jgi:hypothetical protein
MDLAEPQRAHSARNNGCDHGSHRVALHLLRVFAPAAQVHEVGWVCGNHPDKSWQGPPASVAAPAKSSSARSASRRKPRSIRYSTGPSTPWCRCVIWRAKDKGKIAPIACGRSRRPGHTFQPMRRAWQSSSRPSGGADEHLPSLRRLRLGLRKPSRSTLARPARLRVWRRFPFPKGGVFFWGPSTRRIE